MATDRRTDTLRGRATALVFATLLVLAMAPVGAVPAPAVEDIGLNSTYDTALAAGDDTALAAGDDTALAAEDGIASSTTGGESRTLPSASIVDSDRSGLALGQGPATAVTDDCVEYQHGAVFDGYVELQCGANASAVEVSELGGWAYAVTVELPQGYEGSMSGGTLHLPPGADSVSQLRRIWTSALGVDGDEVAAVAFSHTGSARDGGYVLIPGPTSPATQRVDLEPGVYDLRFAAFEPLRVPIGTDPNLGEDWEAYANIVDRSTRVTGTATVGVGGCDPAFDAGERLRTIDERRLEITAFIADARREFARQRQRFALGTAGVTAVFGGNLLTVVSSGVRKGVKGFVETVAGQFGSGPNIATAGEIKQRMTDDAWAKRNNLIERVTRRVRELESLNARYVDVVETIESCNGPMFEVPENYEPISPADRDRARADNGWP